MQLTAAVTSEPPFYVARCLEVEVTSQGGSVEEALANLKGGGCGAANEHRVRQKCLEARRGGENLVPRVLLHALIILVSKRYVARESPRLPLDRRDLRREQPFIWRPISDATERSP